MKSSAVIEEVKKRLPDALDCSINYMSAHGGYFLCTLNGSLRCVYFATPNPQVAAMAGKSPEAWAADSIVHDLQQD